MKRIALILVCCAAVAAISLRPAEAEPSLTIGSKAPSLDIEHWVQDGNGAFKHVSNFEKGKVYVVEFWATWCGPCIMSMPHLAELQTKFRDQDVQIISVSDESLDEVEALLKQQNEQEGKSFAEITSAYTLTTDPDRSTHESYMDAAGQNGIPTSFIVGKSGLIEWIGHPAELDEPLEAVANDSWDREAFKEMLERQKAFEEAVQEIASLAGQGKLDEALTRIQGEIDHATDDEFKERWVALKNRFKLMSGKTDDEVVAYYTKEIESVKGEAYAVGQIGFMIYSTIQQGSDVGPLAGVAVKAIEAEVEGAEEGLQPLLYNTIAQLYASQDNLEKAIAAQEKAVELADSRQKRRLLPFLAELKSKASGDAEEGEGEE